jgi:GTPase SAR1 family protein
MRPVSPPPTSSEDAPQTSRTPSLQSSSADDTLDQLQTPQQVELLDKIDELRNQGLRHHGISLPQLVVCGDQSSGKSSLLEGLTRLRFPAKEGCCTKFATEVVLRKGFGTEISCTIIPSPARPQAQQHEIARFKRTFTSSKDFSFPSVMEEATEKMALGGKAQAHRDAFFEDVLRVRYSGPDLPSLTIVDLPGMIETQFGGGSDAERVAELVKKYIRDERSIILAVVHAGSDLENQKVMRYLEEFQLENSRALGIITKPDKADRGGEEERRLIELVKNETCPLKYRWHAVRNRGHSTRDQSDAERDETERQFFATGSWSSLPREDVGIAALRPKLSRVLLEHISKELPSLVEALQSAITATKTSLTTLGDARESIIQQRMYMTNHAQNFHTLTQDALRGVYSNEFFATSAPTEQRIVRLRTEIQNLNLAFAQTMYQNGHTWTIADDQVGPLDVTGKISTPRASSDAIQEYEAAFEPPYQIGRDEFLDEKISRYVHQSRQSGLPSLVNPSVIGEVFREQSRPWGKIAEYHLMRINRAVEIYVQEALGSMMDPKTYSMLMLKHVQPELEQRWESVETKLEELMMPYTQHEPITYDLTFIQELEIKRMARYAAKACLATPAAEPTVKVFGQGNTQQRFSLGTQQLLTDSMDNFTNSEILDLVQAYYKVRLAAYMTLNDLS